LQCAFTRKPTDLIAQAIDLIDEAAAKLKMEITSKPLALDEIDRKVLQLEMERLSLSKAAPSDRAAKGRLTALDRDLEGLKVRQAKLNEQWETERDEMQRLQSIREEVDRVNLEIQAAERDYDLNRAAELKYGTLINLQKQLKEVEAALATQESTGKMLREEVTEADVSDIISRWTGKPTIRRKIFVSAHTFLCCKSHGLPESYCASRGVFCLFMFFLDPGFDDLMLTACCPSFTCILDSA
jgi:ATP-dependent Clp protease ATP-binding subunit ClpA